MSVLAASRTPGIEGRESLWSSFIMLSGSANTRYETPSWQLVPMPSRGEVVNIGGSVSLKKVNNVLGN